MFELRSSGLYSHNTTQFLVQASAGKLSACAYVLPHLEPSVHCVRIYGLLVECHCS